MIKARSIAAIVGAMALGSAAALADTAGSPNDPFTQQNQQPSPSAQNPTDPAAGSNPAARVPTAPADAAPAPSSEGASSGDAGLEAPAGNPSDPNTLENQQPGPSVKNPADPAAGSDPEARVPTTR